MTEHGLLVPLLILLGLSAYLLAFRWLTRRLIQPGSSFWHVLMCWCVFFPMVLLAIVIHLWRERRQARQGGQS